ncbi:fas-associated death domain protein isoform X2 [Cephus cinctus]|uniref:Fas-associated death domain protein isoform X2 n=1 Tax=Cephus cinctus TaxID=211228 RepID=A0AAJ7CAI6_CEPCN|nr:fas-associated death domain protein isoform X2 [Cephus cinctus]
MINMEKYKQLRESFLKISELHIDNITLNELKLKYKYCINSNRTMGYIKDLEFLIRVLEKRTILRYNNIEPLKYISTQYVKDPALDLILSKYDTEIKTMEYSPFYKSCSQQSDSSPIPSMQITNFDSVRYMPNITYVSVTMVESRLPQSTALPTYDPVELQTQYDPVPITGSSFNKKEQIQRKVFLRISEELGRFWRDLARHLNIRESEIDAIESQTNLDLKNKAYEALKIFASRSDDDSWKSDLLRALDNSRRKDIREMVEKHLLFQDK